MTPSDNVVLSYLPKPCSSFANTNAPTDAGTVIQFFVWLVERQVCCAGYTDRAPGKTLGGYLRGGGSLQLDPWLSGWFATPLQGDSKRSGGWAPTGQDCSGRTTNAARSAVLAKGTGGQQGELLSPLCQPGRRMDRNLALRQYVPLLVHRALAPAGPRPEV